MPEISRFFGCTWANSVMNRRPHRHFSDPPKANRRFFFEAQDVKMIFVKLCWRFVLACVLVVAARATTVPRLSLEDLVDESELILQGRVERSWTAWDPAHRYIWTHHELLIRDRLKGTAQPAVVSEPGGTLDGITQQIAGVPVYRAGEEVIVFLCRTPAGYLRTCGYGQGKYSVSAGTVRANPGDITLVETWGTRAKAESVDGTSLRDFKGRVRKLISKGVR
jgi:hypothetical protein